MRISDWSSDVCSSDLQGVVVLDSKHTLDAIKFMKELYQKTMTPQVMAWDASSNNRAMLSGTISLCLNAISVTREGENKKIPVTPNIQLTQALQGPVRRIGMEHVRDCYLMNSEERGVGKEGGN